MGTDIVFIVLSNQLHRGRIYFWGRKCQFWGRKPEEIKFKPSDIVEILGYPCNEYWDEDKVCLAIIVKTPPTIDEVTEMRRQYIDTHSGYDLCDHHLCHEFGKCLDTYEVFSELCENIDHAPTISVFEPIKKVSQRRKAALMEMYEKYMNQSKSDLNYQQK